MKDFETIIAKKAGPKIRSVLMKGGSASVVFKEEIRIISHSILDRPLNKLPWPLSRLQEHNVRLRITNKKENESSIDLIKNIDKVKFMKKYSRKEINDAINKFLEKIPKDQEISIVRE